MTTGEIENARLAGRSDDGNGNKTMTTYLRIYDRLGNPILSFNGREVAEEHRWGKLEKAPTLGSAIDTPHGKMMVSSVSFQSRGLVVAGTLVGARTDA